MLEHVSQRPRNKRPNVMRSAGFLGTEVELDITNVAHGGVFVARHEGRVIFVADAIPGERVRARITDDSQKSFWRADTLEVLAPSSHRRDHIWAEARVEGDPAERPGGADFGHIALDHQRELKAFVVTDSLSRMAKIDQTVTVQSAPGDDETNGLGYRTREFLHVDDEGRVGPFASRSHRVVTVASLPLATRRIQESAPLGASLKGVQGVSFADTDSGIVAMETRAGDTSKAPVIVQRVGEREFRLRASGFWQVHRRAAKVLTEAVTRAIDDQAFDPRAANLDLYGGVGLLAAAVGDAFGSTTRITSVELDEEATEFAADNLADWVGARAVTARVDHFLNDLVATASATDRSRLNAATIVLDPPRSGAGRSVVDALGELAPTQIVYVACDPVALARDAQLLSTHGYELVHLEAHDLFPHTHHVEAVARFVRG
jgi:tRNA/tmRNA/rRNA uracil-C5-methylase (TrmA/RlmC/RlmD family)